MQNELVLELPKHKCGLFLIHNEHKNYYESIVDLIKDEQDLFRDSVCRTRSIETDELWTLQWYPDTPAGFYKVAAPTLFELLEFALEVERSYLNK